MHVEQSPSVWESLRARVKVRQGVNGVLGENRLVVSKCEFGCAAGSAGKFPFRFSWQPISIGVLVQAPDGPLVLLTVQICPKLSRTTALVAWHPFFFSAQPITKQYGIEPA